ncbi:MAG: 4-hydroxybenzoate octaprenyltransferase [Rhodobacteraceae bacterium]|nr:4-hydroxybenzoate octaprenyltransferase [Paracoccaceae bacterium]
MSEIPPMPDGGRVADAADNNWVDRYAPAATRPYLRLSRADRPAGTWLLLLPCWWGLTLAIMNDPAGPSIFDLWIFAGCGIGAFLMRGAGCTWNDITDRNFDKRVKRTKSRPIPSGAVAVRQALVWMVIQALAAAFILFTFNWFTVVLGIASLGLMCVYPFAKRFTWWPQAFLGLAFNWGALLAWAAHHGSLSVAPGLLYLAGICWTLFYDTIYAHQDSEDDALIGVKSTARLFGHNTPRVLLFFRIAAIFFLIGACLVAPAQLVKEPVRLFVALAAVWAFGGHLGWQIRKLDINDGLVCMLLFRSNRDAGLILVAGWWLAIFAF